MNEEFNLETFIEEYLSNKDNMKKERFEKFQKSFDNFVCALNRVSNIPYEEHPLSTLSELEGDVEITDDFHYTIKSNKDEK